MHLVKRRGLEIMRRKKAWKKKISSIEWERKINQPLTHSPVGYEHIESRREKPYLVRKAKKKENNVFMSNRTTIGCRIFTMNMRNHSSKMNSNSNGLGKTMSKRISYFFIFIFWKSFISFCVQSGLKTSAKSELKGSCS